MPSENVVRIILVTLFINEIPFVGVFRSLQKHVLRTFPGRGTVIPRLI